MGLGIAMGYTHLIPRFDISAFTERLQTIHIQLHNGGRAFPSYQRARCVPGRRGLSRQTSPCLPSTMCVCSEKPAKVSRQTQHAALLVAAWVTKEAYRSPKQRNGQSLPARLAVFLQSLQHRHDGRLEFSDDKVRRH